MTEPTPRCQVEVEDEKAGRGRRKAPQNRAGTGRRSSDGRFVKGESGNPGGRPRGLVAAIREQTGDGEQLADFMLRLFRGELPMAELRDRIGAAR